MVIPVDGSGDGGLMSIVKSPTYSQDRLMYAYISTPTDNRVIRIAEGDVPKDLLTGIPKGATGNTRVADLHQPDDPGRADRRRRQPGTGQRSQVAGGQGDPHRAAHHRRTGPADDRAERDGLRRRHVPGPGRQVALHHRPHPSGDRLQRIGPDSKATTVWTWPDKPGVAGCAALDGTVLVNLVNTKQTVAVRLAQATGAVTGDPEVVREGKTRARLGAGRRPDGNIWGRRSTAPPGTPRNSTTWSSRCSRRVADSPLQRRRHLRDVGRVTPPFIADARHRLADRLRSRQHGRTAIGHHPGNLRRPATPRYRQRAGVGHRSMTNSLLVDIFVAETLYRTAP